MFLVAWLALAGPMFLRMPETNDAEMFDLQAWLLNDGHVLYRDVLEPNLPGVVWLHLLVRSVAGNSSEALRAFDLLAFAFVTGFAFLLLRRGGASSGSALWACLGCSVFYLSTSEWCHCQRDMWMLAPTMTATWMRVKQRERAETNATHSQLFSWSSLEGLVWGIGIWIKPYVLFVTVAVWLCTLSRKTGPKRTFIDSVGLLAGGLVAGGAGLGWMISTGAWPHWLDTMQHWNPRYLQAGRENWTATRFKLMVIRFLPWFLLHLVAVPVACRQIRNRLRRSGTSPPDTLPVASRAPLVPAVLASVYLVWIGHSFLLQHLFDYVHAPGIVLAIVVCTDALTHARFKSGFRLLVMLFGVAVVASSPVLKSRSLSLWKQCVALSRTVPPELQDELTHFDNPRRTDLAAVAGFLRQQKVKDEDVLIYNSDAVSLYRGLHLRPPSRYVYFFETLVFFPDRRQEVIQAAMASSPRFIVVDLVSCRVMTSDEARTVGPAGASGPPPKYRPRNSFPWKYPAVFRSGSWMVLETRRPTGSDEEKP